MATDIKVKRGYDLRLKGQAEKELADAPWPKTFAVKPPDFHSVVPQLKYKKPGVKIEAGDELFHSKYSKQVKFVAPVSGVIKEIVRGERRRVMEIIIESDKEDTYKDVGKVDVVSSDMQHIK